MSKVEIQEHHLRAVRRRLRDLDVGVFELRGLIRGTVPATVLFAGRRAALKEVKPFLFSGPVTVAHLGWAFTLNLRRRVQSFQTPNTDALMWEAWPWEDRGVGNSYLVQAWMDAHAQPGRDFKAFMAAHMSQNVVRSLKKAAVGTLTLRLSLDPAEHEHFYHELLVPMAVHLFGEDRHVPDLAAFLRPQAGAQRELLLLEQAGTVVAGAVLMRNAGAGELALPHYGASLGVLQDNNRRREAMALLNKWVFEDACLHGLQVNLALTRPFLDDGVFNYKRQWGCTFHPLPAFARYHLALVSPRHDEILAAAPLFHLDAQSYCGEMVFAPSQVDPVGQVGAALKAAVFPGLRHIRVTVVGCHGLAGQLARAFPSVKGCGLTFQEHEPAAMDSHPLKDARWPPPVTPTAPAVVRVLDPRIPSSEVAAAAGLP